MAENVGRSGVYRGLRVVELADDPGGELSGKLLSDLGAEVIKIEPPEGSASRRIGPFAGDRADANHSLPYWYYNTGKRSVVLDVDGDDGRSSLYELLATADILLTTGSSATLRGRGISYEELSAAYPRLIAVSVTAFGLDGPWSDLQSSDLVNLALGGPLFSCGYDDLSVPPIRPGGDQSFHTAASFVHTSVLAALLQRQLTGEGQLVDVSIHSSLAVTTEMAFAYWTYQRTNIRRMTCRHAQPVLTQPSVFRCADGKYIYLMVILAEEKGWKLLVDWMASKDLAVDLTDEAYLTLPYRQENFGHIYEVIEVFCLLHDADTLYREGQERGLPGVGIIYAPEEIVEDRHLAARGFFVRPVDDPGGPLYPGAPYRFSAFDWELRRPPNLGEHTDEFLAGVSSEGSPSV